MHASMEIQNQKKSYPSLPSNYVTLAQLQQRWLNQQNHKQQQVEEQPIAASSHRAGDSVINHREPEAGNGIGDESADLDGKVAESSKKKGKPWKRNRKPKPKVEQEGAIEEGSKAAVRSEVNGKKGVDSVKVEEEKGERKFGVSPVNTVIGKLQKGVSVGGMKTAIRMVGNEKKRVDSVKFEEKVEQKFGGQNGRMNKVEQKGARVSEGGSKITIGSELNEKRSVDSVKLEEEVEQKFRDLTVKGNQKGRMRRMNKVVEQKGESEGGSKTMIGIDLNEKKSVEEKVELKFGGLTVKMNQNGGMRRMSKVGEKGASEGGSKTAIGSNLNKKEVVDLVKFEEKVEHKFGHLTVKGNQNGGMRSKNKVEQKVSNGGSKTATGRNLNEKKSVDLVKFEEKGEQKFGDFSVKGNQNGRMRSMNKVEQNAASEEGFKTAIRSELNEKKSVDLVKFEEKGEQKFGDFSVSVKGNQNGRIRRMYYDHGFRHSESQRNGHGNGYLRHGFNGQHSNFQRGKSDKMVWVRKDDVGAGAGGEIESET